MGPRPYIGYHARLVEPGSRDIGLMATAHISQGETGSAFSFPLSSLYKPARAGVLRGFGSYVILEAVPTQLGEEVGRCLVELWAGY